MVQVFNQVYSFEDYLKYEDETDNKHELVNGELKLVPPASGFQALILVFLYDLLRGEINRLQQSWKVMPGTVGVRTAQNKSRIPDLVVLSAQQCQEIREMSTAVLESPPLLAVEIVSPGTVDDDYRYKRSEYAVREIPEYWIINPKEKKVSVLTLVAGFYEVAEFRGEEVIESLLFSELTLTAQQIFAV
jgi:Uma2 family endonuclease